MSSKPRRAANGAPLVSTTQTRKCAPVTLVRTILWQPLPRSQRLSLLDRPRARLLALLRLAIQRLRNGCRAARLTQPQHLYLVQTAVCRNRELIADTSLPCWLHRLPVAQHTTQLTRPRRQRPCLEKACRPEPLIQSNSIHASFSPKPHVVSRETKPNLTHLDTLKVMLRLLATLALLLAPAVIAQSAAQSPAQPPAGQVPSSETNPSATISVRSSLVIVPALVKTKSGQLVFTLKPEDFTVKDDGIPQKLQLEEDTDSQPLALVVVVQVGGDGIQHLPEYGGLAPLLDAIVGNVPHRIAIVDFDSEPELLHGFTSHTDEIVTELNRIESGDGGAAILDAMSFATNLLRKEPPTYRRAILLLSETLDQSSHIDLTEALHELSDTNTSIYAVGFASTKTEVKDEARKLNRPGEPGPPHGCFSRDPNADPSTQQSRAEQNFDCIADLLPPLRLARMIEIATRNSLRKNVPETCAKLSGGEYFSFKDGKSLRRDLFTISNDVPNRYVLTFRPESPHPGLHALTVQLNDRPNLRIDARTEYWVDGPAAPASQTPK